MELIFNLPLLVWNSYKYFPFIIILNIKPNLFHGRFTNRNYLLDPTQIYRTLKQYKKISFVKIGFFMVSFFLYLYR